MGSVTHAIATVAAVSTPSTAAGQFVASPEGAAGAAGAEGAEGGRIGKPPSEFDKAKKPNARNLFYGDVVFITHVWEYWGWFNVRFNK